MAIALGDAARNPPLTRLAAALARLTGWRRALVAIALGAAAAAALPPVDAVPLPGRRLHRSVWLADGAGARRRLRTAFWIGWWFGLGFFTAGLYWIAAALFVDIAKFWWLLPFAVLGLPAFFGLFTGAVVMVYAALGAVGIARPLALASLWTAAEFVRGHLLTGFPWNLIGSAWSDAGPLLQAASVVGIYGLSWLTVAWAALPAVLAAPGAPGWRPASGATAALGLGAALLVAVAAAGGARLAIAPDPASPQASQPDIRLRLVQPNIEQSLKWRDSERAQIFRTLLGLSEAPAPAGPPTAIIWPEAATPFLFEQSPEARAAAAAVLPADGLLITGTPRATPRPGGGTQYWNGLVALDHADQVRGTYDKFHLVPFGEYVPLSHVLPIARIAPGGGDGFSAGPGPRSLRLPGLPPVGPLICYEVIFPGEVIDPDDRPAWLLNLTNDAWYGDSSGPYQHFASARARAVEQGLPLVRAANTGISGVIDPYGRVIARLGLGRAGVVDALLPRGLPDATVYQRFGGGILAFLLLAGLAAAILSRRHARA